jgi:hypothetical protein
MDVVPITAKNFLYLCTGKPQCLLLMFVQCVGVGVVSMYGMYNVEFNR